MKGELNNDHVKILKIFQENLKITRPKVDACHVNLQNLQYAYLPLNPNEHNCQTFAMQFSKDPQGLLKLIESGSSDPASWAGSARDNAWVLALVLGGVVLSYKIYKNRVWLCSKLNCLKPKPNTELDPATKRGNALIIFLGIGLILFCSVVFICKIEDEQEMRAPCC